MSQCYPPTNPHQGEHSHETIIWEEFGSVELPDFDLPSPSQFGKQPHNRNYGTQIYIIVIFTLVLSVDISVKHTYNLFLSIMF